MPIYEYACGKCESEFEAEQRITDDPLKKCPQCGSKRVKRLISRTSFALKGGGWYADGYGSASSNSSADSTTSPESKSSAASAASTESADSKLKKQPAEKTKGKKAVA
jgi:putative FmdB family regulatory protein